MSIGTFADRATRMHIKQTTKQKKVVFGERPLTISAQSLKVTTLTLDKNAELNQSKELDASIKQNQELSVTTKPKGSGVPWYILSQDNSILRVFHILMGVLSVPSVILNLFL